ncbi:hypothetical protein [Persephonella sp. KM09-Lau-8]|uniref:hypothetical protein n=1 Tax=Persephonella sp. KM09-Lau-8 TaxID=1158345 RepID=UPI0004965699|nr:hypothetical protein [Persephonella sp. KM09-Lau-8]
MKTPQITEELIEQLKKELQDWKKVTQSRIEWANETVDEIIETLKENNFNGNDDIKLLDCPKLKLGLRYRGAQSIGFYLYLVDLDNNKALPPSTKKIDSYEYLGGNFSARVIYMNSIETLETLKKIPEWIECIKEKIETLKKEYQKIKT